ncbi:MAG: sigma-70 family RNA polymerase sigma factor [Cytophagia bacterium]|nr:sigma-70 family RNA polymerase sigma factor [Cytophagia bacterium]
MINDPDLILIKRILEGEQHLYAQLVNKHKRYAYSLALRVLEDKSDAEEVAQDAFVKAFKYLAGFNRDAKFSTWLYRIVFNTAISYKRKQKAKMQSIENVHIGYQQDALEKSDKKRFIEEAIAKLSEADRVAITLFYLQEFSLEEIADITNTPANTVKVRIHRARQRLAEELKGILNQEALSL